MRVNVYAEELPEASAIEIISKATDDGTFTGLRIPLYLPVTLPDGTQARGKFMHHPGDDDSSAVTIWGKRDLRNILKVALAKLDDHYDAAGTPLERPVKEAPNVIERAGVMLRERAEGLADAEVERRFNRASKEIRLDPLAKGSVEAAQMLRKAANGQRETIQKRIEEKMLGALLDLCCEDLEDERRSQ